MSELSLPERLEELQHRFLSAKHVKFFIEDELIGLHISNPKADATVLLQGAQLLQFTPHYKPQLVWHSKAVAYKKGTPLRGGIPICWPWFGPLANNIEAVRAQCSTESPPAHGFARNQEWHLEKIENLASGATKIQFSLQDNELSRMYFDKAFTLILELTIATELTVALRVQNNDALPMVFTGALHTYFAIYDINKTRIYGLDDLPYVNSVEGGMVEVQQGAVVINSETDRIYFATEHNSDRNNLPELHCAEQIIKCSDRKIALSSKGSCSVIVWNPWIEKSRALSQFNDDEYLEMLCVETANAHSDVVKLAPGETHVLEVSLGYSV